MSRVTTETVPLTVFATMRVAVFLSAAVVWIFPSGPRRTIPQHADFASGTSATCPAATGSSSKPTA